MTPKPEESTVSSVRRQQAMSRKPANERASERVRIGAPATLKWGEQETTGFVEVVNVAGMYVATSRSPRAAATESADASIVPPTQNPSALTFSPPAISLATAIARSTPCSR